MENAIEKLKRDRAEMLEFDSKDTEMREKIKTALKFNEEMVKGVCEMENTLLGKEIMFNPFFIVSLTHCHIFCSIILFILYESGLNCFS